jgi:hypothetical protein
VYDCVKSNAKTKELQANNLMLTMYLSQWTKEDKWKTGMKKHALSGDHYG